MKNLNSSFALVYAYIVDKIKIINIMINEIAII